MVLNVLHLPQRIKEYAPGMGEVIFLHILVDHGNIRPGQPVVLVDLCQVDIADHMAAGNQHIILGAAVEVIPVGVEVVQVALHNLADLIHSRRQDEQTAPLAVQIPLLAGAQVIHQRAVFGMGKNRHIDDAGIHHAGHDKIDQTVARSEGNRGQGALVGQLLQIVGLVHQVHNTKHIFHEASFLSYG
ncbi:hypothetical protein D3C75_666900 [compost metagenome]